MQRGCGEFWKTLERTRESEEADVRQSLCGTLPALGVQDVVGTVSSGLCDSHCVHCVHCCMGLKTGNIVFSSTICVSGT